MAPAWVPYNLVKLPRGAVVGLDAYFWPSLSRRYRVVLLAHPAENLSPSPGRGCRLPRLVEPENQLQELEKIASMKARLPRLPRPSLLERLLAPLVPPRLLRRGLGEEERVEASEEVQARGLARLLRDASPAGGLAWAEFSLEDGLLLPRHPRMARIYGALAERDAGYREASRRAAMLCRGDRG